jgi:hypothetical protein
VVPWPQGAALTVSAAAWLMGDLKVPDRQRPVQGGVAGASDEEVEPPEPLTGHCQGGGRVRRSPAQPSRSRSLGARVLRPSYGVAVAVSTGV